MTRTKPKMWATSIFVAVTILVMVSAATAGQVTGAIFTTLEDGTAVNHNIYSAKEAVYLNGGPQPKAPCTAAGLPDGMYYFQVTDPSGKILLSTDDIAHRKAKVAGGVFVDAPDIDHYVPQVDGTGPFTQCNGITVQLAPYNDTPNPGGEYKVWVTKTADYKLGAGSFGFIPSKTKTDNFKVVSAAPAPDPTLDSDGDGIPDVDELQNGTNPFETDSDHDGIPDGEEIPGCPLIPDPSCGGPS